MAYIGNTVENQGFTPAIDYFNGNGVTVTFTLSRPIASVAQVIVAVDNVIQNPSSAFNVVGNSITFTSAPLSGTNNIWVEYTSLITTYQGISQDPTVIGDIRATGGYLAEGDFGNSFIDGAILDYVTGAGRVTVGELDDLIFYHGGTAGRSEMMKVSYAGTNSYVVGNFGVGTTTPNSFSDPANNLVVGTTSGNNGITIVGGTTGISSIYLADGTTGNEAYRGYLEYGHTSDYLAFGTAASERMRIDSAGRVTMPFQPAFQAYGSVNVTPGSGVVKVTFASTAPNISSSFSTVTSRFTAPVAGTYSFTGIITYEGTGSANYVGVIFYKNGSNFVQTYGGKTSGQYSQIKNSLVATLSAGDYIEMYTDTNSGSVIYEGGRTFFMGYLIG